MACLNQLVSSLHIKIVGITEFVALVPSGTGKLCVLYGSLVLQVFSGN